LLTENKYLWFFKEFYLLRQIMKKSLIIFYSLEWFTKKIAHIIAEKTWADLLQIHPKQDIKTGSKLMKYFRWGKQVFMKEIPELKKYTCDLSKYDTIYIGTPVRAYTYTPAIKSFLKQTEIKNKSIILFCSHEGWPGKALANLENDLSGNKIIKSKDFNRRLLENNKIELEKKIDDFLN